MNAQAAVETGVMTGKQHIDTVERFAAHSLGEYNAVRTRPHPYEMKLYYDA